jgi:energy-converting hydrogenase Eha subunit H
MIKYISAKTLKRIDVLGTIYLKLSWFNLLIYRFSVGYKCTSYLSYTDIQMYYNVCKNDTSNVQPTLERKSHIAD